MRELAHAKQLAQIEDARRAAAAATSPTELLKQALVAQALQTPLSPAWAEATVGEASC